MSRTLGDTLPAPRPSIALLGLEGLRASFEYAGMRWAGQRSHPTGDGHPVIVFPGLATDRRATAPLLAFCAGLGYEAHDWGRGFNTGPHGDVDAWIDTLAADVAALPSAEAGTMSLVGWSLGGIYAREVAKRLPGRVRQVITIGTPFAGTSDQTHAGLVYRLVNGRPATIDEHLGRQLRVAPAVPTTSIYSRTDGVVAWQACVQPGRGRYVENIEVDGSHCGLGWNRHVLAIVADRLAQPEGRWTKYRPEP